MSTRATAKSAGLRARKWRRFLRGPDPMLLDELYVPALGAAVRYDRSCAYFSSSVLAAAARGFAGLIERLISLGDKAPRPAVRLVVNEQLEPQDVQALMETGDTSKLEEVLRKRFKSTKDVLEKQRLAMLAWLVSAGLLEIRVGVMRHGTGIVHAKFGIMYDHAAPGQGDAVVFNGSSNESAAGLTANYEQLEVSTSWEDKERLANFEAEFKALWGDAHPDVHTVSLPEALRLKLIKLAPAEPPAQEPSNALARQKAAMVWKFIVEAPYLPNGAAACDATLMVDLWPHQRSVVEETSKAWPAGRMLCDEVGMGKTIEAIGVLRRLLAGRGVKRALLLAPFGLLKQWQAELREKGALVVPRLEGINSLVWPDDRQEKVDGLADALRRDILLVSRETARTENNVPILLAASPWDMVLLDEAHAARRAKQVETEFNSANLLLDLLRRLQLQRRARSILLLSATPMQTHPWEPWDLLSVLGEGGAWLADFTAVRGYYDALARISRGCCDEKTAIQAASLALSDQDFPKLTDGSLSMADPRELARGLAFAPSSQRPVFARWLRTSSPLARRMHRNTRTTLRHYYELGLVGAPPAVRQVMDVQFDFTDHRERAVYNAITRYINRRFRELEGQKPGKGFVMTIYRRRATSSPASLKQSLSRRRDGLLQVIGQRAHDITLQTADVPEAIAFDDMPEGEGKISLALPQDPETARSELGDVDRLLQELDSLGATDSKRDKFFGLLRQLTDDGRSVLVFTEYVDTMVYLRDSLADHYGSSLGCYSGDGGQVWDGTQWKMVSKDTITRQLRSGQLKIVICTDAASEGLNLQAAGALVNYDLPWNPSKVEQRIGRIDRIGQRHAEILIVNMFLKDSVDQKVYGVLRERCHLFEHFVGAMQPVLSRARQMLMEEKDDLDSLIAEAQKAEQDALAVETYVENPADPAPAPKPPLAREHLIEALALLDGSFGPKAVVAKGVVTVSGGTAAKVRFGASQDAVEADRQLIPLCPLQVPLRELAEGLWRPGERLPLLVASAQAGPLRRSVAMWVSADGVKPVSAMGELQELVEAWDGVYPDPAAWKAAEQQAAQQAACEVKQALEAARVAEGSGLARQIDAARLRLLRELGRYLVCVNGDSDELNRTFHEQMSRDIAGAKRLKACFERLGGYPQWPESLRQELAGLVAQFTDGQRRARLAGAELEAALNDPRWAAAAYENHQTHTR